MPEPEEQTYIHDKYIGELLNNILFPETRQLARRNARMHDTNAHVQIP
jgi:hypothetical protein